MTRFATNLSKRLVLLQPSHSRETDGLRILRAMCSLRNKLDAGDILKRTYWKHYYALRAEFYATAAWAEVKRRVRARDKVCVRCGGFGNDVHHKRYLQRSPEWGLNMRNLELLCVQCHADEHNK